MAISQRRAATVVDRAQADVADRLVAELRSITDSPMRTSPARGLNGLRSTSQLRSRSPSLPSSARRLALTKMRRRWLSATKPTTRGGCPGRPATATMSWIRPICAPAASSSGNRITRNA